MCRKFFAVECQQGVPRAVQLGKFKLTAIDLTPVVTRQFEEHPCQGGHGARRSDHLNRATGNPPGDIVFRIEWREMLVHMTAYFRIALG